MCYTGEMSTIFTPRVLTGETVDLISPFPPSYLPRLVKWSHQYKSLITSDFGPQTDDELETTFARTIDTQLTYGVVDKANKIGLPEGSGPIVIGAFMVEETLPTNCYLHVISQRRAWGKGLMDEAAEMVIADLFGERPDLQRLSGYMMAHNRAVQAYTKRHGFRKDGMFKDMLRVDGKSVDVVHMGLTRVDYESAGLARLIEE